MGRGTRMVSIKRVLILGLLFLSTPSWAFQILAATTQPCHERMLLGVFGQGPGGFIGNGTPSVQTLLNLFVQRVEQLGVPQDRGTQGLMREMNKRFLWDGRSEAEIFVFSSFVAGVRNPDTRGFSIVDINQVRSIHVRDDDQDAHTLRQSKDDEPNGSSQAINDTVTRLYKNFTAAQQAWASNGFTKQRWTFAFYGEQEVNVFGPAYQLGLIAHAIQDSYAHAVRDDNLKIVTVLNYVDLMLGAHRKERDGLGHSDRMDRCDAEGSSFDQLRINEARVRVAEVFNAAENILANNLSDISSLQTIVGQIYDFRSGCDISNDFCGSSWYAYATSEVTKPLLSGCGLVIPKDFSQMGRGSPQASTVFLLLVMPLLMALVLRFKKGLFTA